MVALHRLIVALTTALMTIVSAPAAFALIHRAPVVIQGSKVKSATHYPINMYRLFRTDPTSGKPVAIPFQIDEINEMGDYVLPLGGDVTAHTGTGSFGLRDELVFMGDDVGPVKSPSDWSSTPRPTLIFEIRLVSRGPNPAGDGEGAVYLCVYFQTPPPLATHSYVNFARDKAEVVTSRYRYAFDQNNWLVARQVDMIRRGTERDAKPDFIPLLDSTTFYMKADLKYFLTVEANHRSVDSKIEAYKIGPVRALVRISFHYTFLKLNFELGMYTEVSFFSNAVFLPAVVFNPIDGRKSLNKGSGFYYGLALRDSPSQYQIETNMPEFKPAGILDMFSTSKSLENLYWIVASNRDRMMYMEITPSKEMRANGAVPLLYREDADGKAVSTRGNDQPQPLGSSPVNLGLYFDMTRMSEGEHAMAFRLFFENANDVNLLAAFKHLSNWTVSAQRVRDDR